MELIIPTATTGTEGSRNTTESNRVNYWSSPAVIAPNNFVYKSLSNWAVNIAVGCSHACRFCYVPSAATIKQGPQLARYGVSDPDLEWGQYVLLRPWDETKFLASLRAAENTPPAKLKPDGNRAVFFCSTTDPYQVIHHPDPSRRRELDDHARALESTDDGERCAGVGVDDDVLDVQGSAEPLRAIVLGEGAGPSRAGGNLRPRALCWGDGGCKPAASLVF